MELNSFLFPAPQPSYTVHSAIGDLLYIPRRRQSELNHSSRASEETAYSEREEVQSPAIPCLYLPNASGSTKLLIYFHGNAEDVGLASELLDYIRSLLKIHVLAVEYPGYGVYEGQADAQQILIDAETVYDYLTKKGTPWRVPQESIILFGRSIGSGPATHLAACRRPCSLLLMSPFKSIRDIVKEQAGSLLSYVISDRFRNIDAIEKVRCPTFFVHGQRDTLISFRHSQEMHYKCGGPSALIMPRDMDHNEFDFIDDLITPFHQFLKQCKIDLQHSPGSASARQGLPPKPLKRELFIKPDGYENAEDHLSEKRAATEEGMRFPKQTGDEYIFRFPESLYTPPEDFPRTNTNGSLWNLILRKFM